MTPEEIKALQDKAAAAEALNAKLQKENEKAQADLKAKESELAKTNKLMEEMSEQLTTAEANAKSKKTIVVVGKDKYTVKGKIELTGKLLSAMKAKRVVLQSPVIAPEDLHKYPEVIKALIEAGSGSLVPFVESDK